MATFPKINKTSQLVAANKGFQLVATKSEPHGNTWHDIYFYGTHVTGHMDIGEAFKIFLELSN